MSHLLSVKIPHSLLHSLEEVSQQQGVSKGAVVRDALEDFLQRWNYANNSIQKITQNLLKKKKNRGKKVDWDELRKLASLNPYISPEEEVRMHRRRGL